MHHCTKKALHCRPGYKVERLINENGCHGCPKCIKTYPSGKKCPQKMCPMHYEVCKPGYIGDHPLDSKGCRGCRKCVKIVDDFKKPTNCPVRPCYLKKLKPCNRGYKREYIDKNGCHTCGHCVKIDDFEEPRHCGIRRCNKKRLEPCRRGYKREYIDEDGCRTCGHCVKIEKKYPIKPIQEEDNWEELIKLINEL
jgi:hypothetical protein